MRTRTINQTEAGRINLTKKFGVYGDGCIGIWGEGDTVDEAIADAGANQIEYSGCEKPDFSECEIVTLEKADSKSAMEIIRTVYDAGATDKTAVEDAYNMVKASDIDAHIASGGTIGNYQW